MQINTFKPLESMSRPSSRHLVVDANIQSYGVLSCTVYMLIVKQLETGSTSLRITGMQTYSVSLIYLRLKLSSHVLEFTYFRFVANIKYIYFFKITE